MGWSLKVFRNWISTDDSFHSSIHLKTCCHYVHTSRLRWILCVAIIVKFQIHVVYLMKIKVSTYRSYEEHFKLYIELYGSVAVNSCQIRIVKKYKIVLEDDILLNHSKSASSTFCLNDYIQFTFSRPWFYRWF